jgi:hypothetical protein
MSALRFEATGIGWSDENQTLSVGVHRAAAGEPNYLLFQRSLEDPDPNDSGLYVEINDQISGAYHAVQAIRLTRDLLDCVLDPEIAAKNGLPVRVLAGLKNVPKAQVAGLAQVLQRVIDGLVPYSFDL